MPEGLFKAISAVIKRTSCNDTWDFALACENRSLQIIVSHYVSGQTVLTIANCAVACEQTVASGELSPQM